QDAASNSASLSGAATNPAGTLQIDTTAPTSEARRKGNSGIDGSGNGDLNAGHVVTLTVNLSEAVTVAGGTPTLSLNNGGTASYTGGSGTAALSFSYTVGAGQDSGDLAVTSFNLNGATLQDAASNSASLSGAATNPAGTLQRNTTPPTATPVASSYAGFDGSGNGDLNAGHVVTLTVNLSEAVTVAGGTPTLSLNNGGTASYTGGSGTAALSVSYPVGASFPTRRSSDLSFNLNGATLQDAASNSASLSGAATNPAGTLQRNTTPPTATPVASSYAGFDGSGNGDLNAGHVVTLTVNLSEAVTVAGGTPTLSLNNGGTASYTGGSGTAALSVSYPVGASFPTRRSSDLSFNLNGATLQDAASNSASLSGAATNPAGTLQRNTTPPTATPVASSYAGFDGSGNGDLNAGHVVTLTVNLSEAVTVAGGTPTLSLNNGGTASYTGGSGTAALSVSYPVGASFPTRRSSDLSFNLNGATLQDAASNSASLSGAATNPAGTLQRNTTPPTATPVASSYAGFDGSGNGDLNAGHVVTLTVNLSEAVTVAGGTPTLSLNNGGTASYTGGSGTAALSVSYPVGASFPTRRSSDLSFNLNGATLQDAASNSASLSGAATNPAGTLQRNTTPPTATPVASSYAGFDGSGNGDLNAGHVVTLTVNLSEAVTVAGGTPTLSLNNGGTASYTGGSGTAALSVSYPVGASFPTRRSSDLSFNLNGATLQDAASNSASLSGAATNPAGTLQRNTTPPTATPVASSYAGFDGSGNGDLNAGHVVTLTVNLSEAVTVAGGTPTLSLNNGGTASYTGGSGTAALSVSYPVGASFPTRRSSDLSFNLNGATLQDAASNSASLSGAATNPAGTLQRNTTPPTATPVASSYAGFDGSGNGDLNAGHVVTLTVNLSEAVTVAGGTPTLSLNNGGTASYTGGSGTAALSVSYPVGASFPTRRSSDLSFNLNGATLQDAASNSASLSGAATNPAGTLQIDTTAPAVPTRAEERRVGNDSGNREPNAGHIVTMTVNQSEAVTVAGGKPTLSLNNGGTASSTGVSGTAALRFSYTVGDWRDGVDLAETSFNLNGATLQDAASNSASLSGAATNPAGTLQIDTTAPAVPT